MVKPIGEKYNSETYGQSNRMPKGPHQFNLVQAFVKENKYGIQWELHIDPLEDKWKRDVPFIIWIPEEGAPEALADTSGKDPYKLPVKDYQPCDFVGMNVWAEVVHETVTKKGSKYLGKTFAKPKRLHPHFSSGGQSTSNVQDDDFKPSYDNFDDDFDNNEVPF